MRLLNVKKFALEKVNDETSIPYVILSHRWFDSELEYQDIPDKDDIMKGLNPVPKKEEGKKLSIEKIKGACEAVRKFDFQGKTIEHIWIDTICIDKQNYMEYTEALNSMYRWYRKAFICFTYLSDIVDGKLKPMDESEWFTRGWTLQELVAPTALQYFDKNWKNLGARRELSGKVSARTGISSTILDRQTFKLRLDNESISHRMAWFSNRKCTKKEDVAYALMGIFGVNMPVNRGEGLKQAFRRLQEEILWYSDDHSLFAWTDDNKVVNRGTDADLEGFGLLAPTPSCFQHTGHYRHTKDQQNVEPYSMTNKGLSITLRMFRQGGPNDTTFIASLDCKVDKDYVLGIFLRKTSKLSEEQYCRIRPWEMCKVHKDRRGELRKIYVKQPINF